MEILFKSLRYRTYEIIIYDLLAHTEKKYCIRLMERMTWSLIAKYTCITVTLIIATLFGQLKI